MFFKGINFKNGKIIYEDFDLDPSKSLKRQIFSLKEDLFQAEFFNGKYLIDIGWSPELDPEGFFKIVVIKNLDWINPIFFKKTNDLSNLKRIVEQAIEFINKQHP